jgi:hypothetical protein
MTTSPEDLIAYYTEQRDQWDWSWATAATEAWVDAAHAAGLDAQVYSNDVPDENKDAAIVTVAGRRYVLVVPEADGPQLEVRAEIYRGRIDVSVAWEDWDGAGTVTLTNETGSIHLDAHSAVELLEKALGEIREKRDDYGRSR